MEAPEASVLLRLHDSLLQNILTYADIQSRVAISATCRRLARVSAEHPPTVVDLSSDGVHPEVCRRYIERAKGAIVTLVTARQQQRTACDAASARRFRDGVRCTQVVPYTTGPAAVSLAACLPNLKRLALHEATSCLGGMTDEFAIAVAARCPQLSSLEVAFTRYSLPSEFFTDTGMRALAAGCPRLTALSLTNCGAITDRSLYAVAVHCRGLTSLALGGYHELITDYGTVVLFQACNSLERVVLSGKLRRVTDESAEALAAGSGATLQEVKLTRSMGDRALAAFAAHCTSLRLVDCCKCEPTAITPAAVASLLRSLAGQHPLKQSSAPAAPPAAAGTEAAATAGQPAASAQAQASSFRRMRSIRAVLPTGLAAADVVSLGPSTVGEANSEADTGDVQRWRVVRPAAPSPFSGMGARERSLSSAGGTAASVAIPARSGPSPSVSPSGSSPSSSLSSSPGSPSLPSAWVVAGGVAAAAGTSHSVPRGTASGGQGGRSLEPPASSQLLQGSGKAASAAGGRSPAHGDAGRRYEEVLVWL